MTTKVIKRSIAPPMNPANQKPIQDLKIAVDELSGSVGLVAQRAVRLCELVDAGVVKLSATGLVEAGSNVVSNEFNSVLTVRPQGGAVEGGELMLKGAASYSNARIDNMQTTTRFFGGAAQPMTWDRETGDLSVYGPVRSRGGTSVFFFHDRTTDRGWGWYGAGDTCYLFNGVGNILVSDNVGNFYSGLDNQRTCGAAGNRWSVVYAGTGTINTSDARDKTPVRTLEEAELGAAKVLAREVGFYQWLAMVEAKGEEHARLHCGFTVQRAIEVMESFGLDPMRYGFICYDSWPATEEIAESWEASEAVYGENGELITPAREAGRAVYQPARPAGDGYSFRPDQLLLFIAAGFEARLSALENANGPA